MVVRARGARQFVDVGDVVRGAPPIGDETVSSTSGARAKRYRPRRAGGGDDGTREGNRRRRDRGHGLRTGDEVAAPTGPAGGPGRERLCARRRDRPARGGQGRGGHQGRLRGRSGRVERRSVPSRRWTCAASTLRILRRARPRVPHLAVRGAGRDIVLIAGPCQEQAAKAAEGPARRSSSRRAPRHGGVGRHLRCFRGPGRPAGPGAAVEISHSRLGRPADRLQLGQAVVVKVLQSTTPRARSRSA